MIAAAGVSSALVYRAFGPPWHVLAGAFCGIAAAAMLPSNASIPFPVPSGASAARLELRKLAP